MEVPIQILSKYIQNILKVSLQISNCLFISSLMFNRSQDLQRKIDQKEGFLDMLRDGNNFMNLVVMVWTWSFTSFAYYLVSFYIKYFKGSVYLNSFLFGVAGLAGTLIFAILVNFMTSKNLLILSFIFTFVGSLGFTLTIESPSLVPIWILWMVTSLSIQFSLCYMMNWDLFKPKFRTRIYSICNIWARLWTVLSPMLVELMTNPIILMSVWAVAMVFLGSRIRSPEKS